MKESTNTCQIARPSLLDRMFPLTPMPSLPEQDEPFLRTEVLVYVSFWDRLKLLISGKAMVCVRTFTDVEVKNARSLSCFSVLKPTYPIA